MLKRFLDYFEGHVLTDEVTEEHGIEFATAALLIEVARSDEQRPDQEQQSILNILSSRFDFTPEELAQLVALADEAIEAANDLHQFTRLVNDHYDYDERKHLVELLWQVAYADGRVDKFEEHIIRRIAGLLHLDNKDFVHARHIARDR